MSRNQSRIAPPEVEDSTSDTQPPVNTPQPASPFNFIVPTEMVDLPSKGEYYPESHPLHNVDAIEIKHMTAKEEDILTSATLLKKGIALDKMLQSIIVDNRVKVGDLLIGDKNALLIASRVYGYGSEYKVSLLCPECNLTYEAVVDLNELSHKNPGAVDEGATKTANNTFVCTLPRSEVQIEFRLLTSKDQDVITDNKNTGTLTLLKLITVSVNNQTDKFYIEKALESLPILDTSILKRIYATVMPDVNMIQTVDCIECGEESEMGVPLNAEFFWPDL